jgi:hypothetical protein
VKRVFYRGDWTLGGRFHGGFWQRLSRKDRLEITLGGRKVIEDDYRGLHIALLYGLHGACLHGDPYDLGPVSDFDAQSMRKWVKDLALVSINAHSESSAFSAFRDKQPAGADSKRFSNSFLSSILARFRDKHPLIADALCSDYGVKLMAIDGRIASRVIDYFTRQETPVLCVHDSILIDDLHSAELRAVMKAAIALEVPAAYRTEIVRDGIGMDDFFRNSYEEYVLT